MHRDVASVKVASKWQHRTIVSRCLRRYSSRFCYYCFFNENVALDYVLYSINTVCATNEYRFMPKIHYSSLMFRQNFKKTCEYSKIYYVSVWSLVCCCYDIAIKSASNRLTWNVKTNGPHTGVKRRRLVSAREPMLRGCRTLGLCNVTRIFRTIITYETIPSPPSAFHFESNRHNATGR